MTNINLEVLRKLTKREKSGKRNKKLKSVNIFNKKKVEF